MSDPSGTPGALLNGPESRYVVAALEALLDGDTEGARVALHEGAEATSWASVTHRLDVAGRALAVDATDGPGEPVVDGGDQPDAIAARAIDPRAIDPQATDPQATDAVFDAWARGEGLPVTVDLTTDELQPGSASERAWLGLVVLASLVERSGFPPQVVA